MKGEIMNHRIMIYCGREPKVRPGRKEVSPADKVAFEARGSEAEVFFPPPPRWPFREDWQIIHVAREGVVEPKRIEFIVKEIKTATDLEEFPYAVYCADANSFAVGESDPIIIIKRPNRA
jgi:hypothetical protein